MTEDNDHLGLIVFGLDEEIKNIDLNIDSAREIIFNLLGTSLATNVNSQQVLLHVWTIYVNPIARSGLAALPVRPAAIGALKTFHHKILRGILKLSPVSPIPPLYFLLGEIPVEAALHLDILTLFWCIWANPQTKIHDIVKYLLMMADSTSLTWSAHLKILFLWYNLPDPLVLMNSAPWPKERWKTLIKTKVIACTEVSWREKAAKNSKLHFLNVQTLGLSGRPHPVLSGVLTTQEVMRSRVHVKMLCGDYPCYSYIGSDKNQDTYCKLCKHLHPQVTPPEEDMVHLVSRCKATSDTRARILPELFNLISLHLPNNSILNSPNHTHLTQLILDPTSLNLPMTIRIAPGHPILPDVLNRSRHLCFALHKDRTRQLKKYRLK